MKIAMAKPVRMMQAIITTFLPKADLWMERECVRSYTSVIAIFGGAERDFRLSETKLRKACERDCDEGKEEQE